MKYQDVLDRVRQISGDSLTPQQSAKIVNEVMRMMNLETEVEYPTCDHTSLQMVAYYGQHGICGICVSEENKRLTQTAKAAPAMAAVGTAGVEALAMQAMANRFAGIIEKHARCQRCGTPLLETKRHGCVECREDRSWLAKITKRRRVK